MPLTAPPPTSAAQLAEHLRRQEIRRTLVTLCASLLAITAALTAGWQAEQRTRLAAQARQSALQQAEAAARDAKRQQGEAADRRLLTQLQAAGRLKTDATTLTPALMADLLANLPIRQLDYRFAPVSADNDPAQSPGARHRPLHLAATVAHESAWLVLLDRLRQQAPALILIRRCELAPEKNQALPLPWLHAECQLEWVTP